MKIFISYRRKDSAGHAGRLFDRLSNWFEDKDIFFDRESIQGGEIFTDRIRDEINKASVVLVIIAPEWLSDEHLKRLHDERDVVRGEIALALSLLATKGRPRVIPVLCGGASAPSTDNLPEDLKGIPVRLAHTLEETTYGPSFNKLLDLLKDAGLSPTFRQRLDGAQPFHTNGQSLSPYFADPTHKLPALYQTLNKGGTALVVATAIHGMGGVGKTQLALKYSHAFRDEYAGVWWFRAEDTFQLEEDCQELCLALTIPRHGEEAYSASMKRWLKQTAGKWLLVYDNADKPASVRPLLPEAGKHHIIYTSRSPNWTGLVKKGEMVEMETWSIEQSLEFLTARLPNAPEKNLEHLAGVLGGLPLALEQACAYIDRTNQSIATYCRNVQKLLDTASPDTGYPHSVLATLSLAFNNLSEPARHLLRLCAWCAPEPIPELLFRNAVDELPAPLQETANDDLLWGEAVAELTGFALAQRFEVDLTPRGQEERISDRALLLHRLTQMVVIHKLCEPATDAPALTALVHLAFPGDLSAPGAWPLARALGPHVLKLEEHFAGGHVPYEALSWLLDRLAAYFQNGLAIYEEADAIFSRTLELDERIRGEDHSDTLTSINNLAGVRYARGDLPGARTLYERWVGGCQKTLGEDHSTTLTFMINLAAVLKAMRDLPKARVIEEKVLEIAENKHENWHRLVLACRNNLALTLKAMGNLSGARALQEKTLEISQKTHGKDHPYTLTTMNNLALTLKAMGDHAGAKALQVQILARRKVILVVRHPATTASAWNLLMTLHQMEDRTAAKSVIDEHLIWLLAEDVELHSGDQRQIRDMLRQFIGNGGLRSTETMQQPSGSSS